MRLCHDIHSAINSRHLKRLFIAISWPGSIFLTILQIITLLCVSANKLCYSWRVLAYNCYLSRNRKTQFYLLCTVWFLLWKFLNWGWLWCSIFRNLHTCTTICQNIVSCVSSYQRLYTLFSHKHVPFAGGTSTKEFLIGWLLQLFITCSYYLL